MCHPRKMEEGSGHHFTATAVAAMDFAVNAVGSSAKENLTLGLFVFPTSLGRILISRALEIDVFGTVHHDPTRVFSSPEALAAAFHLTSPQPMGRDPATQEKQ